MTVTWVSNRIQMALYGSRDNAMKLMQLAQGLTDSSVKKAEALDMLEKGQIIRDLPNAEGSARQELEDYFETAAES